ncbi:ferrochelatase [uncultured Sneathiella sp.]|jgi:ferrochelatase|uniref:ferrochelatase n=1 Tax=uncultured Sneathiella sp. TaxID=879315 RepID=UPI0030DCBF72|tara:strand:- start:7380 stop:8414 length:1035 start_codon:yes stop_codon:yes gene_type:complete
MAKKAIVLFNLGGPDKPASVEPFLFNLFNDPAIIRLPNPFRWLVAKLISRRRAPVAKEIYSYIGGASPILEQTKAQADALQASLETSGDDEYKVFISMRYWHPFSNETAAEVRDWAPDEVILLPLYPQFSSTTTGSSFSDWQSEAKKAGITLPTTSLCCYPMEEGFIAAYANQISEKLKEVPDGQPVRLLFSAHGLPQKIVDQGDPYQFQVEETAKRVAAKLDMPDLDWKVCYQSRVGPMKWLEPSTETEIHRAGEEKIGLVIVPIAFVSEHSETLVELDIEYAKLAKEKGVVGYYRVNTVGVHADFITGLAAMVLKMQTANVSSEAGARICPTGFKDCLMLAS